MAKPNSHIGSGLSELRNSLSSPGEQLYQQLTDLILALDDSTTTTRDDGNNDRRDVATTTRNLEKNIGGATMNFPTTAMMDTSGPSRKKLRRKRRRRRSATVPISSSSIPPNNHWPTGIFSSANLPGTSSQSMMTAGGGLVLGGGGGTNSLSHPSATEFCVSHSPIHGTSDSSGFDCAGVGEQTKNPIMDISDSDMERLIQAKSTPISNLMPTASIAARVKNPGGGGDWLRFRIPEKRPLQGPDSSSSMLSPPVWISAPAESDSLTEAVTPARHSHHRRKRLIKKMAVDQTPELSILDDSRNRLTTSMDVDGSPRHSRSFLAMNGPKSTIQYSQQPNVEEFDARSCISASDTDDGSSDDGRQGDDELSDWCLECRLNDPESANRGGGGGGIDGDEDRGDDEYIMGVPNLKRAMLFAAAASANNNNSSKMLNIESSDTDMSQSSFPQPSRRLLSKSGASMCGALNRRIVQFLQNPSETELSLGELRKRERKEAVKLAMFYHLDIRRAANSGGCRYHILVKTRYSRWAE